MRREQTITHPLVWTLRALGGLLLMLALVSGGAVLWLRGALPITGQTVIYRTGAVPDSS